MSSWTKKTAALACAALAMLACAQGSDETYPEEPSVGEGYGFDLGGNFGSPSFQEWLRRQRAAYAQYLEEHPEEKPVDGVRRRLEKVAPASAQEPRATNLVEVGAEGDVAVLDDSAARRLNVFGHDERKELTTIDQGVHPWRTMGRLDVGPEFCTATMVGKHTALTARHCIFDPEQGTVKGGAQFYRTARLVMGNATGLLQTSWEIQSVAWGTPVEAGDATDWALLEIKNGDELTKVTGYLQVRDRDLRFFQSRWRTVTVAGYSQDFVKVNDGLPGVHVGCRSRSTSGEKVRHDCHTDVGSSGAAVLQFQGTIPANSGVTAGVANNKPPEVVGVHVSQNTVGNVFSFDRFTNTRANNFIPASTFFAKLKEMDARQPPSPEPTPPPPLTRRLSCANVTYPENGSVRRNDQSIEATNAVRFVQQCTNVTVMPNKLKKCPTCESCQAGQKCEFQVVLEGTVEASKIIGAGDLRPKALDSDPNTFTLTYEVDGSDDPNHEVAVQFQYIVDIVSANSVLELTAQISNTQEG